MKGKMLTVLFILGCLAGPAWGGGVFDALDADGDQKITREEFRRAAEQAFRQADKNSDGVIDTQEFAAIDPANPQRFKDLDVNGDGRLDKEEYKARMDKRFQQYDVNSDGVLDVSEFSKMERPALANPLLVFFF